MKEKKITYEGWLLLECSTLHSQLTSTDLELEFQVSMAMIDRCQIAVHQECYGAKNVQDFTSWVCRACEIPDVKRDCCMYPVKGGALKPTDIDSLWVHVTCAWFRPEVAFLDHEKMETAMGILRIPLLSFVKIHGSCIQCCKCATYYHAMCAARAGYCMEDFKQFGSLFP